MTGDGTTSSPADAFRDGYTERLPDELLLQELNRLAEKLGRAPTATEMETQGEYSPGTYENHFGSWNGALREAGFEPAKQHQVSSEEILEKITRMVLSDWTDWLATQHGVTDLAQVDVLMCRQFARHLKSQVNDGDFKPSTARTYYAIIRAFLSFCEADELIDGNPAKAHRAAEELPEDPGDVDRQFWSADSRQTLLEYVDERVERTLDGDVDISRDHAYRDRAIIYLLALSGVRGAEVFAVSSDDRRNGITWNGVDLEDGAVRVLGKSRKYEYPNSPSGQPAR